MTRKTAISALWAILAALLAGPIQAQWLVPPAAPAAGPPFDFHQSSYRRATLPALRLASQRPSRVPYQLVVKYRGPRTMQRATAQIGKQAVLAGARIVQQIPQLDVTVLEVPSVERAAEALRKNPDVLWVAPRLFRYPLVLTPNDPAYNELDRLIASDPDTATYYKWDSRMISCDWGWGVWPTRFYSAASPKGSDAVTVAVIDTGIDYAHPDFINAGGTGTSVSEGGQLLRSDDASIFNGVVTPEAPDGYGHGTHVAGIVAAATNNGIGTVGTGYNANILSVRVVDEMGDGTDSDIAQGIVYAVDHGALIINLSLGSYEYSQVEQDAVNYAWRKNVLVIAAAGNDGDDKLNYPSALSKVLSVAATSRISTATYSNYGPFVGLCAPGGDFDFEINWLLGVYSTMPTYWVTLNDPMQYGAAQDYDYLMGTSMAAPHVAGVAAIRAGQKGYTRSTPHANLRMWQDMQRSADGSGGWNPYLGFGMVNVEGVVYEDIDPNWRGDTVGCITGQVRYRGTPVQNAAIVAKPVGGGANTSVTSRSDGGYRFPNLPFGAYTVTASIFGESQRLDDVVVVPGCDVPGQDFNISSWPGQILVDDVVGGPTTDVTLGAVFSRADTSAPVEDARLWFSVDGTELGYGITDVSGRAEHGFTVPMGMVSGSHPITVNYYGEGAVADCSGSGTLTVPGGFPTSMYTLNREGTVTELTILRAYLSKQSDRTALPGKTVRFRVDGTDVGSALTDDGGRASLNWVVSEGPATRAIEAIYDGDAFSTGSSASAALTTISFATKMQGFDRAGLITDYTLLKSFLYRMDNTPVYNKLITFKVDGSVVGTDTTTAAGRAQIGYTIPDGAGAGVRSILAQWAGDGGYGSSWVTNTLTVGKTYPYIWVLPKSVQEGGVANLYAYFRRLYDYQKQAGKTVQFMIDGTPVQTVVTDANGVARYYYQTVEPVGAHTIRCEFAGDAWLEPGFGEGALTIY